MQAHLPLSQLERLSKKKKQQKKKKKQQKKS